ncbi:toxin [Thermoactinomyces sp. DSM 45891]|uniref:hypothetical protein n=1 Tax=Thermoactinomyces sp. DSM 45891 TaxID=1761907 RepID=UPI00090EBD51|nr:hypothetical protein [Thermoactinomyces sp. DSM 45891]SFX64913.1 toxin [Thermoactinomyces sp. DSM 45891]
MKGRLIIVPNRSSFPRKNQIRRLVYKVVSNNGDGAYNYSSVYAVDPEYIDQCLQMASLFDSAIDPNTFHFDLQKAIAIANDPDNDLTLLGQLDTQVYETKYLEIATMADQIMNQLSDFLNAPFPEGDLKNQLTAAMQNTFANLNTQEDSAWIFWSDEQASNTTYLYNILFAVEVHTVSGPAVYVCPMGFEISVDIEKEKVLFITIHDSHTYSVRLQAVNAAFFSGDICDNC